MAYALVPILAQALTLDVGDRTEVRYRVDLQDQIWEGETRPSASLELTWPTATLGAAYTPSLTISPLALSDDNLTVLHVATVRAQIRQRTPRTAITFNETAGYSQQNLGVQALAAPRLPPGSNLLPPSIGMPGAAPGMDPGAAPGMDPGAAPGADPGADPGSIPGVSQDPAALDAASARERASRQTIQAGSVRSDVAISHQTSRTTTLGVTAGYDLSGGLDAPSREVYPLLYGPDAELTLGHAVSRRDTLRSWANGELVMNLRGDRIWLGEVGQGIAHIFGKRARGDLGVGASYARVEPFNQEVVGQFYAVASAGFDYATKFQRGWLTLHLGATNEPVVDRTTARIDPRLGLNAGLTWVRRRLTLYAGSSAAISLEPDSPSALNAVGVHAGMIHRTTDRLTLYAYAEGGISARPDSSQSLDSLAAGTGLAYDLGAGFAFDGGVRGAFERFEGVEIVPASFGAFAALSWYARLLGQ